MQVTAGGREPGGWDWLRIAVACALIVAGTLVFAFGLHGWFE